MTTDERKIFDQVVNALYEARGHLGYCGYGDSWERECAEEQGLPDTIDDALAAAEKVLSE